MAIDCDDCRSSLVAYYFSGSWSRNVVPEFHQRPPQLSCCVLPLPLAVDVAASGASTLRRVQHVKKNEVWSCYSSVDGRWRSSRRPFRHDDKVCSPEKKRIICMHNKCCTDSPNKCYHRCRVLLLLTLFYVCASDAVTCLLQILVDDIHDMQIGERQKRKTDTPLYIQIYIYV